MNLRRTSGMRAVLSLSTLAASAAAADGQLLRYADTLEAYVQGPAAEPGYTDPAVALGQPNTGHTPTAPVNTDPNTGQPVVVSLGQGGSITLGFNMPVRNQPPSAANPYGYDLLIWGNAFQGGAAITPEGWAGRFQEQGFVEVARTDSDGQPGEWLLILPRIFHDDVRGGPVPRDFTPAELLPPTLDEFGFFEASGDLSTSSSLFDGFADAVPARGGQLAAVLAGNNIADVILDDPATYAVRGLGGSGIDIARAVRQSSPGVPLLIDDAFVFVPLDRIDRLRITDARTNDRHPGAVGPITTEVDGIIVLPDLRGCNSPFADADGDGDVDMDDFGAFQACYSSQGDGLLSDDCVCFDRDGDGRVNSDDLAVFRLCAATSGPDIPADADCDRF